MLHRGPECYHFSRLQTDHSSDSRLTHILILKWYWPCDICPSIMVVPKSQDKMFHPPDGMKRDAHVPDFNSYLALYRTSLENPEGRSSMYLYALVQCLQFLHHPLSLPCDISVFNSTICSLQHWRQIYFLFPAFWKEVADEFFWKKPATGPMMQYNFDVTQGNIYVKFMEGAKTNMCYNVVDRLIQEKNLGNKVAYFW